MAPEGDVEGVCCDAPWLPIYYYCVRFLSSKWIQKTEDKSEVRESFFFVIICMGGSEKLIENKINRAIKIVFLFFSERF